MPELPEVQTTVTGLQSVLPGVTIKDVWSDYYLRSLHSHKQTIKNPDYFKAFRKSIIGAKVKKVSRRGKNILIDLSNDKTILVHMKMTGHFLYGRYKFTPTETHKPSKRILRGKNLDLNSRLESVQAHKPGMWTAIEKGALQDPFNKFIHLLFTLSNSKHLAFSDMRKFGKVIVFDTSKKEHVADTAHLGPDPFDKKLTFESFYERMQKKKRLKIKTALMDQTIIAGIGNIYSDEILWDVGINPEERVENIPKNTFKKIFESAKKILSAGIELGGDSLSDYRNIHGERGGFQNFHKAYRRTGKPCLKKGCKGIVLRKIVGGRSAHFCSVHQKLLREKAKKK